MEIRYECIEHFRSKQPAHESLEKYKANIGFTRITRFYLQVTRDCWCHKEWKHSHTNILRLSVISYNEPSLLILKCKLQLNMTGSFHTQKEK